MCRQMNQIAAIKEGHDLHALGQNVVIDLLNLGLDAFQRRVSVAAFLQQHRAFHHIRIVDQLCRSQPDRSLISGPSRILGPCSTTAMSLMRKAVPACVLITVSSICCTFSIQACAWTLIC